MQNLSLRVMDGTFMATHVHMGGTFEILVGAVPVSSLHLRFPQRAGFASHVLIGMRICALPSSFAFNLSCLAQ